MTERAARSLRFTACTLGALAVAVQVGRAQEAPSDGITCFCIENARTKQFRSGCTGDRYGQEVRVTATCTGGTDEGAPAEVTVAPPWSVIPAGEPRCEPCRATRPPKEDEVAGGDVRGGPLPPAPAPIHPAAGTDRDAPALRPARSYLRAADIPPPAVGAYGVVALRARPTPANRDRLLMVCAAYVAHLPRQDALPPSVPVGDQMVTVWPLDRPDTPQAQADDCGFAIDHYDLYGGLSAIQDAERQGAGLGGEGPFLIGWSPSNARGARDKVVLVVDMSGLTRQANFDEVFLFWQRKVVEDPELWRSGFKLERLRLAVREFVDRYGTAVLDAVKLVGGKG